MLSKCFSTGGAPRNKCEIFNEMEKMDRQATLEEFNPIISNPTLDDCIAQFQEVGSEMMAMIKLIEEMNELSAELARSLATNTQILPKLYKELADVEMCIAFYKSYMDDEMQGYYKDTQEVIRCESYRVNAHE